jgi:hypothetical protein
MVPPDQPPWEAHQAPSRYHPNPTQTAPGRGRQLQTHTAAIFFLRPTAPLPATENAPAPPEAPLSPTKAQITFPGHSSNQTQIPIHDATVRLFMSFC